jgi:hypothetical protein
MRCQLKNWNCTMLLALCMCSCFSCAHHIDRSEQPAAAARQVSPPLVHTPPVSPSRCRIIGTVLEVSSRDSATSAFSVSVVVRIDSILGYGSSFGMPLVPGTPIHLRIASFAQNTGAVSGTSVPAGFAVGSVLQGEIERASVEDDGSAAQNYMMYEGVIVR